MRTSWRLAERRRLGLPVRKVWLKKLNEITGVILKEQITLKGFHSFQIRLQMDGANYQRGVACPARAAVPRVGRVLNQGLWQREPEFLVSDPHSPPEPLGRGDPSGHLPGWLAVGLLRMTWIGSCSRSAERQPAGALSLPCFCSNSEFHF